MTPPELAEQYKNATNLDARIALHSRFSTAKVNWYRWLFDHFTLPTGASVLELGCGPAKLWRENAERVPESWNITLTDASPGMIEEAKAYLEGAPRAFTYGVVDIQAIPFADASFGAVIAVHMLYHVPDQRRALAEVRRVLKPGGRFYASTNGSAHMQEMAELVSHFAENDAEKDIVEAFRMVHTANSFRLEDAREMLTPLFGEVTLHRYESALKVTEAEPLLAYILSTGAASEFKLASDDAASQRLASFKRYLEARLEADAAIHITQASGLFVAH